MSQPLDRSKFLTEMRNPASEGLDSMSVEDQVRVMHAADQEAVTAVGKVTADIAKAVKLTVERLKKGGRLFYFGAGTSGRLGILDASEIPPTFRAEHTLVQGVIAGGTEAIFRAQEGAEDDPNGAAKVFEERSIGSNDVVMGIAAGGTTPYVHGALRLAKQKGCATLFLSCVAHYPGETEVDVVIRPLTGPEVITGSTRLKAGTATKLVLNTLTTLTMVGLGKTYGNLMVDLKASNTKLQDRATRLVSTLTSLPYEDAKTLLAQAGGHVKLAAAMHHLKADATTAQAALDKVSGNLREAIRR